MSDELTITQRVVLGAIKASIAINGWPPTRAELARKFGWRSPNAAETHLQALAKKGAVRLVPGMARGITVLDAVPPSPSRRRSAV